MFDRKRLIIFFNNHTHTTTPSTYSPDQFLVSLSQISMELQSLWSCFSPMLIKSKEYTVFGLGVVLD